MFSFRTGAWEACFSSTAEGITTADCLVFWSGICSVLATLPEDHRLSAFDSLASCSLRFLDSSISEARNTGIPTPLESRLSKVADSICVLSSLPRTFVNADATSNDMMQSGCDTSPDTHPIIPDAVLAIIRRGWPSILFAAENLSGNEVSLFLVLNMASNRICY